MTQDEIDEVARNIKEEILETNYTETCENGDYNTYISDDINYEKLFLYLARLEIRIAELEDAV